MSLRRGLVYWGGTLERATNVAVFVGLPIVYGVLVKLSLPPVDSYFAGWFVLFPVIAYTYNADRKIWELVAFGCLSSLFCSIINFGWVYSSFDGVGLDAADSSVFGASLLYAFFAVTEVGTELALSLVCGLGARISKIMHFSRILQAVNIAIAAALIEFLMPQFIPWSWGELISPSSNIAQLSEFLGGVGLSFFVALFGFFLFEIAGLVKSALIEGDTIKVTSSVFVVGVFLMAASLYGYCLYVRSSEIMVGDHHNAIIGAVQTGLIPKKELTKEEFDSMIYPLVKETLPRMLKELHQEYDGQLDLIVMGESVVPYTTSAFNEATSKLGLYSYEFEEVIKEHASSFRTPLLLGEFLVEGDKESGDLFSYNTAVYFDETGERYSVYKKQILFPLGEYIPFLGVLSDLIEFFELEVDFRGNSITPGDSVAVMPVFSFSSDLRDEYSFTPLICFETLYPELLRKSFAMSKNHIALIVGITQDGWFSKSHDYVSSLHLRLSRFRALETRTPFVRVGTSGISAAYDINAELIQPIIGKAESDFGVPSVQVWDIPMIKSNGTLYLRFGDWYVLVFVFFLFLSNLFYLVLRRCLSA